MHLGDGEATWEDWTTMIQAFPYIESWGQDSAEGGSNVKIRDSVFSCFGKMFGYYILVVVCYILIINVVGS